MQGIVLEQGGRFQKAITFNTASLYQLLSWKAEKFYSLKKFLCACSGPLSQSGIYLKNTF